MRKVLYFTADYCGMCKAVKELAIDGLVEQGIEVEFVDCMAKPSLAEKHGVKKLPTTLVVDHDGEYYLRYEGACPPESLAEWIKE